MLCGPCVSALQLWSVPVQKLCSVAVASLESARAVVSAAVAKKESARAVKSVAVAQKSARVVIQMWP